MSALIDSNTVALLSLALDATSLRHQAIAHNIANANTPGYKPVGVSFEERMTEVRSALEQGKSPSLASLGDYRPRLEFESGNGFGDDKVALDTEVAKLSENTLHHQALLKALNRHFSIISAAINEGKR